LKEIDHKDKATIVITREFKDQVDWLHKKCGETEWSGLLIYSVDGDISTPDDFVMKVEGMWLLDVGSSVYTEFEIGPAICDVMDQFPKLLDEPDKWKLGKIHTHHSMSAYHSGTDMEDLHDHAPNHAYYTSLVVNFAESYDCKIGIYAKEDDRSLVYSDGKGGKTHSTIKGSEYLMVIDCDIEMPEERDILIPDYISKAYAELSKPKPISRQGMSYTYYGNDWDDEEYIYYNNLNLPQQKTVIDDEYEWEMHEISNFCTNWLSLGTTNNTLIPVCEDLEVKFHKMSEKETEEYLVKLRDTFVQSANKTLKENFYSEEIANRLAEDALEFISRPSLKDYLFLSEVNQLLQDMILDYYCTQSNF
jgi:hypothetical protein